MNKKEVKKAPALRFKGFTNDWEQHKLGDETNRIKSYSISHGFEVAEDTGTKYIHYGDIHTSKVKIINNIDVLPNIKDNNYKPLKYGDVIVADASEDYKGIADACIVNTISDSYKIVAGLHTIAFRPKSKLCSKFLYFYLSTDIFKHFGYKTGTGLKVFGISYKELAKFKLKEPSVTEQKKIVKLLFLIENAINLQQRKNILLYKLRKSLLSTLLTDKCTPKVRFKSFLEPLKKQKLGDMAPLRGGFAFKANNYVNTGIPIIRISNILSNGSIGGNFAYYSEQSDDSNYILFNGSALIAMSGATTGKTAILDLEKKKKVYQNQRVGYFTPTKNSDYSFIKAIIKSNYFLKQLNSIMVAGAQPNVSAVDIDNFTFYFPESKKEQKYIGNNFEIINKIILLQKNRVDKLKKLKRSLLQQLFI